MTGYQKLKHKCEKLQKQLDLIKQALTVYEAIPKPTYNEDTHSYTYTQMVLIERNKIDEYHKQQLQYWVAENLDEETILKLLEIKKEIDNDK